MEWYWIVAIAVGAAAAIVAAVSVCLACRKAKRAKRARAWNGGAAVRTVGEDEIDEAALCEIDDPGVKERVKALMPDAIRTEIAAGLAVTTCSKTVYKVILPASAKLAAGISGSSLPMGAMAAAQAGALAASSLSAVMSAASMVVGQYYMTIVNQQLKRIGERLSRLGDFQDSEFKSKVFALHAQVFRAAVFHGEVMEHAAMRAAEIEKLDRLEHTCIELLGQTFLMISGYTARNDLDYPRYIRATEDIDLWFSCQKILLSTLGEIADLKFALCLGAASRKQCDALLPLYKQQAEETQRMLLKWHTDTAKRLGVRISEAKHRRRGLDRVLHWFPSLFKKELKYRDMPAATVALIEHQTAEEPMRPWTEGDLFREDVEIVAKDGKLYYLPHVPPSHRHGGEIKEEKAK